MLYSIVKYLPSIYIRLYSLLKSMFQIYIVWGQRFTKLYLNINSSVRLFYNWNAYLIKLINRFFFFSFCYRDYYYDRWVIFIANQPICMMTCKYKYLWNEASRMKWKIVIKIFYFHGMLSSMHYFDAIKKTLAIPNFQNVVYCQSFLFG